MMRSIGYKRDERKKKKKKCGYFTFCMYSRHHPFLNICLFYKHRVPSLDAKENKNNDQEKGQIHDNRSLALIFWGSHRSRRRSWGDKNADEARSRAYHG